jgi:hypothetical protein
LALDSTGKGHVQRVGSEVRHPQVTQQDASARVGIGTYARSVPAHGFGGATDLRGQYTEQGEVGPVPCPKPA